MPVRLQETARFVGLLCSVFGVLFGLAYRPTRLLRTAVLFFLAGWASFAANYVVANMTEGVPKFLVVLIDVLQVGLFSAFFLCFALAFAVCIPGIKK